MEKTFQVQNVKCGGCANTLKKSLKKDFGDVVVNIEKFPREITLNIEDEKIEFLKERLRGLGYPFVDDEISTLENISLKAKSFVSCAIGKIDS